MLLVMYNNAIGLNKWQIAYAVVVLICAVLEVMAEVWGKKAGLNKIKVFDIVFDIIAAIIPIIHLLTIGVCIYTLVKRDKVKEEVIRYDLKQEKKKEKKEAEKKKKREAENK